MKQQLAIADPEFLSRLESDLQIIKAGLQSLKVIPMEEFLTADEFMERVKISRWKFDALIRDGLLKYKKIGRKYYIPIDQVAKYFAGEMNIEK
jgi:excisionase family DNA binding protein